MKKLILVLTAVLSLSMNASAKKEILFKQGAGMVTYVCPVPFDGDTIGIYYYIPEGNLKKMPVQIVMHGMGRNADGYRDKWIKWADKYGFAVIVPHYPDDPYTEEVYQQGNVKNPDGNLNSREDLIYGAIDRIFDFVRDHSELKARKYNIYGHSAGAQFVHRFLLFDKTSRCEKAVAANSGWYTFTDETIGYPYGLKGCVEKFGLDKAAYYAKDLTILLGDADTLRTSNLRQTPKADKQGLTRLARGEKFYNDCKADAAKMGVPFNWKIDYVPHVGHSNGKMAGPAAAIIYGK